MPHLNEKDVLNSINTKIANYVFNVVTLVMLWYIVFYHLNCSSTKDDDLMA